MAHDGPPVGRAAAAANGFVLHLRRRRCRRSSTGRTADELTAEPDSGAVGAGDSKIKATATGGRRYTCSWLAGHKRRQSTLVDDPVRRFRPLHLHPVHCGQRRPKVASASARFVCRHPLAKMFSPKMQRPIRINESQLLILAERARYDATIAGFLYKRTSDGSKWQLRWFTLYQASSCTSVF